ncbi:hypothetical protein BH11ACT3_BH11ACT3_22330 [soil metagenome]
MYHRFERMFDQFRGMALQFFPLPALAATSITGVQATGWLPAPVRIDSSTASLGDGIRGRRPP